MNATRGIAVNYYCFSNNNNLLIIFVDPKPMDWIWVAYYYYINNNNFFILARLCWLAASKKQPRTTATRCGLLKVIEVF